MKKGKKKNYTIKWRKRVAGWLVEVIAPNGLIISDAGGQIYSRKIDARRTLQNFAQAIYEGRVVETVDDNQLGL